MNEIEQKTVNSENKNKAYHKNSKDLNINKLIKWKKKISDWAVQEKGKSDSRYNWVKPHTTTQTECRMQCAVEEENISY